MVTNIRITLFMMVLLLLVLSGCTSREMVTPSARKDIPPEKMLCVFRSDIDEEYNYDIYLLRADKGPIGENDELVVRLTETTSPAAEVFPTISRDCNTVVYCSSVNDMGSNPFWPDFDLFKVDVTTREITNLTDTGQEREYAPSISADGKILTFMVGAFMKGGTDLYMMNLDEPDKRILIQENLSQNVYPRITADGKRVVYSAAARSTKKMDIFMVDLETREVRNLTRTPDLEEYYPDISDDQNFIVFQLQEKDEEAEEGTDLALPEETGNDGGSLIAQAEGEEPSTEDVDTEEGEAAEEDEGMVEEGAETADEAEEEVETPQPAAPKKKNDWEIWLLNVSSGARKQITDNEHNDIYPLISGDGTWVVYTSARQDFNDDNQNEFMIYIMDLITMKEDTASTQPFHHDTVEISW